MSTARPPLSRGVTAPGALYTYRPNERPDRAYQDMADGHAYHGTSFAPIDSTPAHASSRRDALPRVRIRRRGTLFIQTAITLSHSSPYHLPTPL